MQWWMIALIIIGGLLVLPLAIQGLVWLLVAVFGTITALATAVYFGVRKILNKR